MSVNLLTLLIIACSGAFCAAMQIEQQTQSPAHCVFWHSKVDPKIKLSEGVNIPDIKSERQLLEGMQCLLELEGNENPSTITGATSPRTSQTFGTASIEVAALYYISYLYHEKWDHAQAAALVSEHAREDEKNRVHKAYLAYRCWYRKLQEIGLSQAREAKLEPLKGTGIRWY